MKVKDSDTAQGSNDVLEEVNVVPTNRLDADQYSAEDLDGVTEGVFGSGSVSYASLQAAQTDALIAESGEASSLNLEIPTLANTPENQSRGAAFNSDRPLSEADSSPLGDVQNEAAFTGSTVGSLGASTLSSDVGSFSETQGLSLNIGGGDSFNSSVSSAASTVNNAESSETTNIDNRETNNVEINNYDGDPGEIGLDLDLGIVDTVLTDLSLGLDDSLEGALNVGAVTDNLTDIVEVLTGISLPVFASPTVNILFDLFNSDDAGDANDINIAGLEALDIRLDVLENVVGDLDINIDLLNGFSVPTAGDLASVNVFNLVQNIELATPIEVVETLGAQDIVGTLDVVLNQVHITQDISSDVQTLLDDVGIDLSPGQDLLSSVDTIVEDVNEVLDEVADAIAGLGDGLLPLGGGDNDGDDSDIVADLGLGILDQSVVDTVIDDPIEPVTDIVEDLVGDIDLGLGVATDLLGGDTDEGAEDTDLEINTDIDLVDNEIAEVVGDVALDPVEEVVGDVDLDVDLAADVLGDVADGLIDDGAGGSGEDTLVAEVGDVLSDVGEQVVDVVTDLVGEPDVQVDAVIDPVVDDVDALLESVDIDIGSSLDILNNDVFEAEDADADDDLSWTESTISDGGGLFDDIISGIGGDGDALPDPAGTVAEGLGVLDIEPELDIGSLGGLF